jgi:hypothetical protein
VVGVEEDAPDVTLADGIGRPLRATGDRHVRAVA